MSTIATLVVKLVADAAEYTKGMQSATTMAQQTATNISRSMKSAGADLTNVGKGMTTFVTLPLLAAGAEAITYASNLEETKNKVNVVFGDMSSGVMAWSQNAATAMGMSQQKALDGVSTFGAMAQATGMSAQDNIKWSESMVTLASDWSSFYNMNPDDAMNKIQSAVAGQYEPLKSMGVVLNQATVEQKAMNMGLMQKGGTLSEAARYQAVYALMVEKTGAAQGDFARTSTSVANETRIVKAQFDDAAAALGTKLLPLATQLLGWASQAIAWFSALSPETQKWILIVAGIAAVAGPVLMVVGGLITAFGAIAGVIGAITSPVLIVIAVIAALIAIGYVLYLAWTQNWGGIQEKTAVVWAFVQSAIATAMAFIQQVITAALTVIGPLMKAWTAARQGDWYAFGQYLRQAWDAAWKLIGSIVKNAWTNIKSSISGLISNVKSAFTGIDWKEVGSTIVQGIANGITSAADWVLKAVENLSTAAIEAIKGFLGIASPSKRFSIEVGMPIGQGVGVGIDRSIAELKRRMPGMLGGLTSPQLAFANGMSLAGGGNGGMSIPNYGTLNVIYSGKEKPADIQRRMRL